MDRAEVRIVKLRADEPTPEPVGPRYCKYGYARTREQIWLHRDSDGGWTCYCPYEPNCTENPMSDATKALSILRKAIAAHPVNGTYLLGNQTLDLTHAEHDLVRRLVNEAKETK